MFAASEGNCDFTDYDVDELSVLNEMKILDDKDDDVRHKKFKYVGKTTNIKLTKNMCISSRRNVIANYARFILKALIIHQCLLQV